MFPGQARNSWGWAKTSLNKSPAAQEIFKKADQILGYSISQICFSGPEAELTRTLYAQTGILVTSLQRLQHSVEKNPELNPSLVAGLSLGEFTALTASGAISFEDALKLVQVRAEAMESAAQKNPGTMAFIMGLTADQCAEVAREARWEVANLNAPDQTVLSGTLQAIEQACKIAEGKGAKRAMPLKVGGAFHSSLMEKPKHALKSLSRTPRSVLRSALSFDCYRSGRFDPEEIRTLLAKQLTSSVQWVKTMATAKESGITTFLEIGPGKILKGLAKKCQSELEVVPFGGPGDFKAVESLALLAQS